MTGAALPHRPGADEARKRVMARVSPRAAEALGAYVLRPCSDARTLRAARAAVGDPDCPAPEREQIDGWLSLWLASLPSTKEKRVGRLLLKLTDDEKERIEERAAASGRSVAAYVRARALGDL